VVVGPTLRGGSDACVTEATLSDGSRAILKLALPGNGMPHEIETFLLADGRGYVRLLRHDLARQAMLQERLRVARQRWTCRSRHRSRLSARRCGRAWEVSPDRSFPTGAQKARALAECTAATWEECNRACAERAVEWALSFAQAREAAFAPDVAVLVHGDAHADNTRPKDRGTSLVVA
jgi:streptomycin 6-kinase